MDPYKLFMINIAEELTPKDLQKLAYVLDIPRRRAEEIEKCGTGIRLLVYLEEQTLLGADNFNGLKDALKGINRLDLVEKIDKHIGIKHAIHQGLQDIASGGASNIQEFPPENVEKIIQPYCEKEGLRVNVVGVDSQHFRCDRINFVEIKVGNKFNVYLSNTTDNEWFVDITHSRAAGNTQPIRGKLDAHQKSLKIGANQFLFEDAETATLNGLQYLVISYTPPMIYFQTRTLDLNRYCNVMSDLKHVCIPKAEGIKVCDVLNIIRECYPDVAGSSLYNGKKILQGAELLSHGNKSNPLVLLKQTEKIAIKPDDDDRVKWIDASPCNCTVATIKEAICKLFDVEENSELKVDEKVVSDVMECFKAGCVNIQEKKKTYRSTAFRECPSAEAFTEEEGLDESSSTEKMPSSSSTEKMPSSSSGNQSVRCPETKVVIVIYLVATTR